MQGPRRPSGSGDATTLRLSCDGCDRNLIDVRRNLRADPRVGLVVETVGRPGVTLDDHWGDDGALTITVRCRCGRQHDRREAALKDAWRAATRRDGRVVRAVLGRDV
jgi:hypothetical protein